MGLKLRVCASEAVGKKALKFRMIRVHMEVRDNHNLPNSPHSIPDL